MHGIRNLVFIFTLALVVTLATGWFMSETIFSPGGFISQSYGFPLPWKDIFASCPPPCIQANGTQYGWATVTAGLLFYATIGYLARRYMFREPRRKIRFPERECPNAVGQKLRARDSDTNHTHDLEPRRLREQSDLSNLRSNKSQHGCSNFGKYY